jgi:hypothetical protein
MFDHKPVFISFKDISTQQSLPKKKVVTNWFLDEPLIKMAAELATLQVFSNSINNVAHADTVNNLKLSINSLTVKILDCLSLKEKLALAIMEDNGTDELLLAAKYTEFNEILERLPSWEQLNDCQNLYSGSEVFNAITERITEKVSDIQRKLTKFKNI